MKNCPKDDLVQLMFSWQDGALRKFLKPVPGHKGNYIFMGSPKGIAWTVDGVTLRTSDPVAVLTTSHGDRLRLLKSWRCKRKGKEYGARWVALRDNNGKKNYFQLEELAEKAFGQDWEKLKQQIQTNASYEVLGELF